ncbi:MAG: LptF/LptG family permease [Hyphomicrobiales bacterium]
MFRIADRYILRQVLAPLATALAIGLLMLLADRLVRLLDTTLGKKNSFAVVFELLAYLVPHYLGLAVPAALFLGLLFGFSRMSKASEVDAFLASGIGLHRLAQPVAVLSLVFMAASIAIIGWLQPHTRYLYRSVVFNVKNVDVFYLAEEGVFMQAGTRTFIIDDLNRKENRFKRIFLFDDRSTESGAETVTAARGELIDAGEGRTPILRLETGHRMEIKPWPDPTSSEPPPTAIVGEFTTADTPLGRVSDKVFRPRGNDERELTLPELVAQQDTPPAGATREKMRSELHKRLVSILTIPVLPFLAVPFALGRRRSQRAYRFGAALLILIAYYEVIEQGAIAVRSGASPWLTLWLPFAAIVAFAAWRFWNACFVLGPDRLEPYFEKLARAGKAVKRAIARHEHVEERA